MSYQFPPDIANMVQRQISYGCYETQDDVLRAALELLPDEEEDDDIESLQQAVREVNEGDTGRPAEEVFAELKARHNI